MTKIKIYKPDGQIIWFTEKHISDRSEYSIFGSVKDIDTSDDDTVTVSFVSKNPETLTVVQFRHMPFEVYIGLGEGRHPG